MDNFWQHFLAIEQQGLNFLADSPCRLDHYDIRLRIKPNQHSLAVTGTARGFVIGSNAEEFRFLLGLDYRRQTEASCVVHELLLDGQSAAIMSDGHMHLAAFPKALKQGEVFDFTFSYSTVPVARKCWVNAQSDWPVPGLGDGETELCFEGYWLPFANALFQPVTFDLDVAEVPGSVMMVNGKHLGNYVSAGECWHRYRSTVATFPTLIAGDFKVITIPIRGGSLSFYHQGGYADAAEKVLSTGSHILETFTEWLKISPQGDLSMVQLIRTDWGQYAPFPFVVFPREDIKKDVAANDWKRISQMLAHEIGHFWFGTMLRSAPTEQWLSEGFAQYFNLLYTEYAFGLEALNSEIQTYLSRLSSLDKASQAPLAYIPLEHPVQAILVRLKGAIILHCLRQLLGYDHFIELLGQLVQHYQQQPITTSDVETEVGKFTGMQDARSFFDIHLRVIATYTWNPATETIEAA